MTTAYTALLGLALPVTGENQGTWGILVNQSITSLLDTAISGTTTLSADSDITLTTTAGTVNEARQAIILCSGARTAQRTITAPAQSKIYTIINSTTGGYSVKLVGAGPTTGITVVAGESALVAWNGSDFIKISNTGGSASFTNVTVSGTTTLSGLTASTALALDASKNVVSVTNTGTGNNVLATSPTLSGVTLSDGTANGVLYLNGSKVATSGSALTFDGTTFTAPTLATTATATFGANVYLGANALYYYAKTSGGSNVRMLGINAGNVAYVGPIDSGPTEVNYGAATTITAQYWNASGTEQMRLTSTGLGIGTSSPGNKLDVNGAIRARGDIVALSTGDRIQLLPQVAGSGGIIATADSTFSAYAPMGMDASYFYWRPGGSERMRLDSSGNLGIGTSNPLQKLDVRSGYILSGTAASTSGSKILGGYYSNGSLATWGTEYSNGSPVMGYGVWPSTSASGSFVSSTGVNVGRGAYLILGNQHVWYGGAVQTVAIDSAVTTSEQMRLDASGNLGIGTSSPAQKLHVATAGNNYIVSQNTAGSTSALLLGAESGLNAIYSWTTVAGSTGRPLAFFTGASEAMRLDTSGNLGIGTSSPNSKLVVNGGIRAVGGSTFDGTNGYSFAGTGDTDGGMFSPADGVLVWATNNTEQMRLDSSGNLGLGVTPSAWQSAYKAMDVGNSLSLIGGSNAGDLYYNAYINSSGGFVYRATTTASAYSLAGGQHRWYTAPSGTAGTAISFTQAMTLDASGNLLVGTTSSSGSPYRIETDTTSDTRIGLKVNTTLTGILQATTNNFSIAAFGASGVLTLNTNGAERARIDSSGNLLVGATAQYGTEKFNVTQASAATGIITRLSNGPYNNSSYAMIQGIDGTAVRFYFPSNGGLYNYQANDTNLSDRRLKTDIQPAGSYLDKICAIPVKTFLYKDQTDTERNLGVIAQEVDAVAPEFVNHDGFGEAPEGESPYLGIYQTDLQYALMKCIQEQQAIITDLRARVAQLEAKG